jgi:hypothetical protein
MAVQDDLAEQYSAMAEDQLLRLASDQDQLTSDGSLFLQQELARRGIGKERLLAFQNEEQEQREKQRREIGSFFLIHPCGIGRQRFGKADRSYDRQSQTESFKTTVFILLLWLPLIPTGTFRVERKRSFLSGEVTVLERLPLDWEQVLKVWIVAAVILLFAIWALRLLPILLFRH